MSDDRSDSQAQAEVYRSPPAPPVWREEDRDDISFLQLANVLLRHRWKVLGTPVVVAGLTIAAAMIWPTGYTSEASIVPESRAGAGGMSAVSGQLSQLSGVASQFGVNVLGGAPGRSPQFYADLLMSRRLLEEAVVSPYARPGDGTGGDTASVNGGQAGEATLVELYGIEARRPEAAVSAAAGHLEESVTVSVNGETGVVDLEVTTPWPSVSKQVADRLIALVNRFNNRVRRTQASEQAEFIQGRLRDARQELRSAEDSLEVFLESNVGWQQSPELRFRHDRLERRVSLKQQVYTSLASQYEEARISAVQSTPVVTTVTRPQVPVRPDGDGLLVRVAAALVFGGVMGSLWAFGSELLDNVQDENAEDYREFVALKREALGDIKRVGRKLRRTLKGADADE